MRDHTAHIQVRKEEAVKIILENCKFKPETEIVDVADSVGRILAEDVYSKWSMPNCRTCRLDSVAVRWDDFKNGMPDTSNWERGVQWEFANTGVAMPEGFDTAIVVEHVIFSDNDTKVAFDAMPSGMFAGTSEAGSKIKEGQLLVKKGTEITPLVASYILTGNNTQVNVFRKPRGAFIPTGNELVRAGGNIPLGKNIESNSCLIAAKIKQWGGVPIVFDVVPDEKEAIKEALYAAAKTTDIVVLNAGSSKGNDDWGIEMLEKIGLVFFHETSHGPGHHSSFGLVGSTPIIGISGPPGGAAFTTDFYLYPAMMAFEGKRTALRKIKARLAMEIPGGNKHAKPAKLPKSRGEDRPAYTGEFYSIRQMVLKQASDGIIEAYPLSGAHPSPIEAELGDAYYIMPSGPNQAPAKPGDFIELELRPGKYER